MRKLTKKQAVFIEEFLSNGRNATQAYRRAFGDVGSDKNIRSSASRLLKKPNVTAALVNAQKQRLKTTERKADVTRDFLISQYLEVLEMAKDKGQLSTARSTLDSLGHLAGLWTDKREINTNINVDHTLQQLDTSALLDALQQGEKAPAIEGDFRDVTPPAEGDTSADFP